MGATGGAFLSGLMGVLQPKLDQRHAEEEDRKRRQRDAYLQMAQQNADPDIREWALGEWQKSMNPETRKGAKQISPLLSRIFGARHQAMRAAPAEGAAPFPGVSPASAQPPQRTQQTAPVGATPFPAGLRAREEAASEKELRLKSKLKIEEEVARETAKPAVTGIRKTLKFKLPDGKEMTVQQDSKTGTYYDLQNKPTELPEGAELVTNTGRSGYIRSVPHAVSLQDAKETAAAGAVYNDQAGNPIDLERLPPNMGLQAMVAGEKMFWVPISPNQKEVTVGNVKYGVTPWEIKGIPQGAGTELGAARVPSSGTTSQIGYDAAGNPVINTLPRTTAPATPGAVGRPSGRPVAPPAQPTRATQGAAPGAATRPVSAPPAGPPGAAIRGVPAGQYNQFLNRVTPVREAATQIFGDPSQPDLKGLKDFIGLADDPAARERLGKAFRLTFESLNQATGGAAIHAGAGPISVSTGGFGSVLQNYFRVPQTLADQQAKIMQEAVGNLTPEEREAYDAMMSSFATVIGLRSLTRASSAQASVMTIERELPVIGVNTFDSSQFADQLQRLAEVTANGLKGIPKTMIDPALSKRIENLPSEMQNMKKAKKGPVSAPAATGRPRAVNPNTGKAVEWDGKAWVPAP